MARFRGCGDFHCTMTAILFLLGNALRFYKDNAMNRELAEYEVPDKTYYNDLQPLQLAAAWTVRFDNQNVLTVSIFVTSMAWIFLAIVLIRLAWALSGKGTATVGPSATIVVLAIAGALVELVANLLFLGTSKAMRNIVQTYQLNNWIALSGNGFQNLTSIFDSFNGDDDTNATTTEHDRVLQGTNVTGSDADDVSPFANTDDDIYKRQQVLEDVDDKFVVYNDGDDNGENNFDFEGLRDDPGFDNGFQIDGDFSNSEYDEDGLGWKSLELAYATSKGMTQLVDSFEFILLAAIMVTIYLAVRGGRRRRQHGSSFSGAWSYLGLVMALVATVQFCLALPSYEPWDPRNQVATFLLALNQIILLPIWVIWLGCQMAKDTTTEPEDVQTVPKVSTMQEVDFS